MLLDPQDILARLRTEPGPLSFPKLKKAFVSKKTGITEADLQTALAANGIFAWPKPKNSYWHLDPAAWLENEIVAACRHTAVEKLAFKGQAKKDVDAMVSRLIAAGRIVQYPAVEGKKKVLVVREGANDAYWAYVRAHIQAKLSKAGIAQEPPLDEKILQILPKLEPERDVPVSTARVRRALGLLESDKRRFDEAALRLRQQRKVYLSQHDHALALNLEERNSLIEGNDGKYYVAITRRD